MRSLLVPLVDDALLALKTAGALKVSTAPDYSVDPPKNAAHGDLSCNVAMVMQKAEGQPPRKIAELVAAELAKRTDVIAKVDIAGPGFLNVTLKDDVIQRIARDVLAAGDKWGKPVPKVRKKVLVEFVSANPTGPIHIGHARGSFMGDAISRLLSAAGHDVTREFYINDYGKQTETLGRTLYKRYLQQHGRDAPLGEGEYPGEYVVDIAKDVVAQDGNKWLDKPESEWLPAFTAAAIEANMAAIKASLARAKIQHDIFFSEASLHAQGKVVAVAEHYKKLGATYEADVARDKDGTRREDSKAAQFADKQLGGTFLETSKHGDEEDRIILRKDGTPVYLTADLAYHHEKFQRGFDRIIDVLGADHSGHVPRIKAGVHLLGVDAKKLEFVLVQIVRITRSGEIVKVSKRRGTVFELDDLIEEVGADSCRFLFLMRTANAQFDFDLDLVTKQSKDNPVFYFQMGHARCAQLLKFAGEKGQPFSGRPTDAQLAKLALPEERAILKKLAMLSDVVENAANTLEPHKVLTYCQELISDFHGYYQKYSKTDRIVTDDVDKTQGRLAMVAALKQTLKSAFTMLGVEAPEYMARASDEEDEDKAEA
jgi:arginyl-tRNA synthetase